MSAPREVLNATQRCDEIEDLHACLKKLVVGQDESIREIVDVYQSFFSGLSSRGRTAGNFLLLGPTGTGKTRTVEALAEAMHGDSSKVLRIDCGEFINEHEIAKIIGAPPGYLGHKETPAIFTQARLNALASDKHKISLVLFDEIEKAAYSMNRLLLGVLDKATLKTGDNQSVSFENCFIFMTSNLGSRNIQKITGRDFGFDYMSPDVEEVETEKIKSVGIAAVKQRFTPEFVNRLDRTIVYRPFSADDVRRILDLELGQVQMRLMKTQRGAFIFTASEQAKDLLILSGTDSQYGARYLKRTIERMIVQPLANLLTTKKISEGDWVQAEISQDGSGKLVFLRERTNMSTDEMAVVSKGNLGISAAA